MGEELSASSPQGRFPYGAAELDGRSLLGVEAYGKHLHHRFAGHRGLHVHLGMQGKWRFDRLCHVLTGLMRQSMDDGRILSAPLPAGAQICPEVAVPLSYVRVHLGTVEL